MRRTAPIRKINPVVREKLQRAGSLADELMQGYDDAREIVRQDECTDRFVRQSDAWVHAGAVVLLAVIVISGLLATAVAIW